MFCTDLERLPITTRPMSRRETDAEGNLWFLSGEKSNKNFEIKEDKRVQLIFMNSSEHEYLSVFGEAFFYTRKEKIEEKWTPAAKAWFEDGKDDPNLSVIRAAPSESYFWDTKAGKLVRYFHLHRLL